MMLTIYQSNRKENFMVSKKNKLIIFFFCFLVCVFLFSNKSSASTISGRILLQVEENGEAWYLNPVDQKRYYLGRPENAFEIMRSLGLGALDKDIGFFQENKAPARLSGRILLQVQDKGQAFYVNPLDLKLYYLGRPQDAFHIMRSFALGISNKDLAKIQIANTNPLVPKKQEFKEQLIVSENKDFKQVFNFKYKNKNHSLELSLSFALYNNYKNLQKNYSFPLNSDLSVIINGFYGNFLSYQVGDSSIKDLISLAEEVRVRNLWTETEKLEFLLALVQYIPYDQEKVSSGTNNNPFFPYETLYLNRGVCSDKTFLALNITRELNYGAAILDFPDLNHSALGILCPKEHSIRNSGYCFVETTNYFPPGVVPQSINEGQAELFNGNFLNLFSDSNLGKMEIYQESSGSTYTGIYSTKKRVEEINNLEKDLKDGLKKVKDLEFLLSEKEGELNDLKKKMDDLLNLNKIADYNNLLTNYNKLAVEYNTFIKDYKNEIELYNTKVASYNLLVNYFYQR